MQINASISKDLNKEVNDIFKKEKFPSFSNTVATLIQEAVDARKKLRKKKYKNS